MMQFTAYTVMLGAVFMQVASSWGPASHCGDHVSAGKGNSKLLNSQGCGLFRNSPKSKPVLAVLPDSMTGHQGLEIAIQAQSPWLSDPGQVTSLLEPQFSHLV